MKPLFLTLALSAASLPCGAAIVYSNVSNTSIPFNEDGVYLNVSTGVASATEPGNWETSPTLNFFFGGVGIGWSDLIALVTDISGNVTDQMAGNTVGSLSALSSGPNGSASHVGGGSGQFTLDTPGYIGFAFRVTGSEPDPYYGWLKFTPSNSGGAVIESWAYESNAGQSILVGAIPEPATLTFLCGMALAGVSLRRRAV